MGILRIDSEIYLPTPLQSSVGVINAAFGKSGFELTQVLEVLGRLRFQRTLLGNGNTSAMLSNGYANIFEATCQMFPIDNLSTKLTIVMTGFSEEDTWLATPIDLLDEVLTALATEFSFVNNPEEIALDSEQVNFQHGTQEQGSTPF